MKKLGFAKALVVTGLTVACASSLVACGSSASSGAGGAVAATVYGTDISEDTITEYVQTFRTQYGMDSDESWASYLIMMGYTPESLREMVLDNYINIELMKHGAAELGIEIDETEVDTYVQSMRAYYIVTNEDGTENEEATNEAWANALAGAGYTEEEYRDSIMTSLTSQAVQAKFAEDAVADDAQLLESVQLYAPYYDGARRSSHILFAADDVATAQSVLDQINAGTLDFATAAQQYSLDGSGADGGDVGWDKLHSFVTEYAEALSQLGEGQVSGLVESQYGIHIIKCTQLWNAPEEVTSLDQVPAEIVDSIRSTANSSAASTAYQEWLAGLRSAAEESGDIVINSIPADAPYNIDLTPYQETEDEAAAEAEGEAADGADAADAEADAEGAAADEAAEGADEAEAA